MSSYFPSYDLPARISHTKLDTGIGNMPAARLGRIEDPSTPSFSTVLNGFVDNFNEQLNAPDALMKDVMSGNHNADIHDVMIAMSKAEININVMTSIVGKVIQAYDKIMQIQV